MHTPQVDRGLDRLGGRLRLLFPADLTPDQKAIHEALSRLVVPEAAENGFTARLDDGRFVGPFNALLRIPEIAAGMGAWTSAIAGSGMADEVRQVVILTVGVSWSAAYEIDAHVAAAHAVGVPAAAVEAVLRRTRPVGLSPQADVAHRLAAALLEEHAVPDDLYGEAIDALGEAGLLAILSLIGQYQVISSILVCFQVPVPPRQSAVSEEGQQA